MYQKKENVLTTYIPQKYIEKKDQMKDDLWNEEDKLHSTLINLRQTTITYQH